MKDLAPNNMTFQSEHAWMVQCLSLAMIGLLTYLNLAPIIGQSKAKKLHLIIKNKVGHIVYRLFLCLSDYYDKYVERWVEAENIVQ